jgi:predicted lactoylglutathione lyase
MQDIWQKLKKIISSAGAIKLFFLAILVFLATLCISVPLHVQSSLSDNMSRLKNGLDLRADAAELLPLLLIQDDAIKTILMDPNKFDSYAAEKIAAYDRHMELLNNFKSNSQTNNFDGLIDRLQKIDSDILQPLDTKILELAF